MAFEVAAILQAAIAPPSGIYEGRWETLAPRRGKVIRASTSAVSG